MLPLGIKGDVMRIFVAAMVMMMGLSVQAHAAFYDGNRLNEACQSEQNHGDGICHGYVTAIVDVLGGLGVVCAQSNVTAQQAMDVVKQWLEQNPARRHETAAVIVTQIISETWPCK